MSSSFSVGSTSTIVVSQVTPIVPKVHHPGYQLVPSVTEPASTSDEPRNKDATEVQGFGLSFPNKPERSSVARVPLGFKSSPNQLSPVFQSSDLLLSPLLANASQRNHHHHRAEQSELRYQGFGYYGSDVELSQGQVTHNEYEALNQKKTLQLTKRTSHALRRVLECRTGQLARCIHSHSIDLFHYLVGYLGCGGLREAEIQHVHTSSKYSSSWVCILQSLLAPLISRSNTILLTNAVARP